MTTASPQELKETIQELTQYRDRLLGEVTTVAVKLRMNQKKIDATLKQHSELNQINELLTKLISEQKRLAKSS